MAVNISRVIVNCFDVIVFAMLHAHGIWQEIVSLLKLMLCDHELANEWACCSGKNAGYVTKYSITSYVRIVFHLSKRTQLMKFVDVG